MDERGQTSIEFLVLLGFMLLVFTGFFVFAEDMLSRNNEQLVKQTVIVIGEHVREELFVANQVRNGYERTFTLPFAAAEQKYSVQILKNQELVINTSSFEHLFFLPFNVTIDSSDTGYLVVGGETHLIKNSSGIYLMT